MTTLRVGQWSPPPNKGSIARETEMASQDWRDCRMMEKMPNNTMPSSMPPLASDSFLNLEVSSNRTKNRKQAPAIREPCWALR
ncbi:hypothetical protein D3C72_2049180 [compost metagenome]